MRASKSMTVGQPSASGEGLIELDDSPTLFPQYPDPDSAANITSYPWLAEPDEEPSPPPRPSLEASDEMGSDDDSLTSVSELFWDIGPNPDDASRPEVDSEYRDFENPDSYDENMSDGDADLEPTHTLLGDANDHLQALSVNREATRGQHHPKFGFPRRAIRRRRTVGLGKGNKGVKRGLRKPIEPSLDFTAHLSEATMAFTNRDYVKAENCTLMALKLNPEMFQAHNLLSEIHALRGDWEKAISAAWTGAHTRPRDAGMWNRVAMLILEHQDAHNEESQKDALYCYSRIIAMDRNNIEARSRRAALNRELGRKRKVVADYEFLLKCLPKDTTVLRHLADIYIEMANADKALQHYKTAIADASSESQDESPFFSWSDVNIMAELYIILRKYEQGLVEVKHLCRWLLGRRAEIFWDDIRQDDREWDSEDTPRRNEVPGFQSGVNGQSTYGQGLPFEIRVKLGVFRLLSNEQGFAEAMAHFEWLEPEDNNPGAPVFEYPDLFRETAKALRLQNKNREAIRFLDPLRSAEVTFDEELRMDIAHCYKGLGLNLQAKASYEAIINSNPDFTRARVALSNMAPGLRLKEVERSAEVINVSGVRRAVSARGRGNRSYRKASQNSEKTSEVHQLYSKRPAQPHARASDQAAETQALYARYKALSLQKDRNDGHIEAWFEVTKLLLQVFRDNKVFFPADRSQPFRGYVQGAQLSTQSPKSNRHGRHKATTPINATPERTLAVTSDQYLGIPFAEWLDVFLEYSLELMKKGDVETSYDYVRCARSANVFFHSPDANLAIHVCWFACCLYANDEESLCNVIRWFIAQFQYTTDSYLLFSALHRLCDSSNAWFNCSASQKYIMRQLKAVDFSLLRYQQETPRATAVASKYPASRPSAGAFAEDLDAALLMLYGHMLYAGRSYTSAISYFLRALSIDGSNKTIKQSLAYAYIHWALKRQAENRHCILVQGFGFLMEYYDECMATGGVAQRQEAAFNLGRTFHLLGLVDLALTYYERCLHLGSASNWDLNDGDTENFAHEAALALQAHYSTNENFRDARAVTDAWLVI